MPGNRPRSVSPGASFEVRLAPVARRQYENLGVEVGARVRSALMAAAEAQGSGRRLAKAAKTLRGTEGPFHRLRVGGMRVMYDVVSEERAILVLGIVDRRDLERWLRTR